MESVQQLSFLENALEVPQIPGLKYLPDFISAAEEAALVAEIDRSGWCNVGMRRLVRQFGICYSFSRRSVVSTDIQEPIPEQGTAIARRLVQAKLMPSLPNQMLANRYLPGEGISFHVDAPEFAEIADLSLLSDCVMEFRHTKTLEKQKIWLDRRSLLLLTDEARWQWEHSIPYRQRDRFAGREQMRQLRISLTYRSLVQ